MTSHCVIEVSPRVGSHCGTLKLTGNARLVNSDTLAIAATFADGFVHCSCCCLAADCMLSVSCLFGAVKLCSEPLVLHSLQCTYAVWTFWIHVLRCVACLGAGEGLLSGFTMLTSYHCSNYH